MLCLILGSIKTLAQRHEACACGDIIGKVLDEQHAFISGRDIEAWINNRFLPLYNQMELKRKGSVFPYKAINILSVDCVSEYGAVAKKCEKEKMLFKGNPFLIIYDNDFIQGIHQQDALTVLFVLGHELGHLIADHYHTTVPKDKDFEKYLKQLGESNIPIKKEDEAKVMTIRDKQIEELTADAYAVWFLRSYYEQHKQDLATAQAFHPTKISNVFSYIEKLYPNKCEGSVMHPSCKQRSYFVKKINQPQNWNDIIQFKKHPRGFASEYFDSTFAILSQEEAKAMGVVAVRFKEKSKGDSLRRIGELLLNKEDLLDANKFLHQAADIYYKLVFTDDFNEVLQKIEQLEKVLSIRSFTSLSLTAGGGQVQPSLKSNDMPVNTTIARLGYVGFRVGRYSYNSRLGFEIDFKYNIKPLQFDTYQQTKEAIERFSMSWVAINPSINYRLVELEHKNKIRAIILGLGGLWQNPVGFKYENFIAPENQTISVQLKDSWGLSASLGYEFLHRRINNKVTLWKIGLTANYQPLMFENEYLTKTNATAAYWMFGVETSFGLFPPFFIRRKLYAN